MNATKDVIRDLLPVYVAGEASADTQALVEEALAGDPGLRAEAGALGTIPVAEIAPPEAVELNSLRRMQFLLRRRAFLVGAGYLLTTLPLALADRHWGPVWFGVPSVRYLLTACMLAAIAAWLVFMRNAQALHAAGLEPPHSRIPLFAWGFAPWWIANSAAVVVNEWIPRSVGSYRWAFLLIAFLPFYVIGLRLGQFRTAAELDTPQSLMDQAKGK